MPDADANSKENDDLFDVTLDPLDEDIDFGAMCPKVSIQVEGADLSIYDDISGKTDEQVAAEVAQKVHEYVLKILPEIREDLARVEAMKNIKVDLSGL